MDKVKESGVDAVSTDFVEFLKSVRRGGAVFDCATKLEKLVALIRERRKTGRLVIELTISPEDSDAAAVTVQDKITVKEPEPPKSGKTFFFTTRKNTLQRDDPRQDMMDLDG